MRCGGVAVFRTVSRCHQAVLAVCRREACTLTVAGELVGGRVAGTLREVKNAWRTLRKRAPHMLLTMRSYHDVLRCKRHHAEKQFFCLDFDGSGGRLLSGCPRALASRWR